MSSRTFLLSIIFKVASSSIWDYENYWSFVAMQQNCLILRVLFQDQFRWFLYPIDSTPNSVLKKEGEEREKKKGNTSFP